MQPVALNIAVREMSQVPVDLSPRRVLAGRATEPLRDRMTLAQPVLAPIKRPDADRAAVQRFLDSETRTHDFFELHLVINLYPDTEMPYRAVGVGVSLMSQNDHRERPVAWSLFPLRATAPVKVTKEVGLNAKLGFVEPTASLSIEHSRDQLFTLALGEGESDFEWRFQETASSELSGIHRMFAVVKAPKGAPFAARVEVSATVGGRKLGIFRFTADLPDVVGAVYSSNS